MDALPGTALGLVLPEPEQDQVVAGLLARLWARPARRLPGSARSPRCARPGRMSSSKSTAAAAAAGRIDPGLAKAGIALLRELPLTAASQAPLATDLHGDNILAAQREPWLVVGPKPCAGDPACDLPRHMLKWRGPAGRPPSRAGQPDGGTGRD